MTDEESKKDAMTFSYDFKHQSIEVPFLDQTHKNFDKWVKLIEEKKAEIDRLLIQKLINEVQGNV
jgi:transcription termination factor NusB